MKRHCKTTTTWMVVMATVFLKWNAFAQKPNILFIVTDDQRYDSVEAFNEILHGRKTSNLYNPDRPNDPNWGYVESPNVNKLVAEGTTFINTHCQAMGCAPSRASMFYGRYPFRSGIYEFEYHNNTASHTRPTMFEELKKLGYQTMHSGKLGLRLRERLASGRAISPQLFDVDIDSKYMANQGLMDSGNIYRNYVFNSKGEKLTLPKFMQINTYVDNNGKEMYVSKELEDLGDTDPRFAEFKGGAQRVNQKYNIFRLNSGARPSPTFGGLVIAGNPSRWKNTTRDGYYTSSFINYLKSEKKQFKVGTESFQGVDPSKPFFTYLGYDFPHTPVLPAWEFKNRFNTKNYKIPTVSQAEKNGMPKQYQGVINYAGTDHLSNADKLRMIRDYYAFCAHGDYLIGRAVNEFKAFNNKHNKPWMIVYVCGDHGWKLNEHGAVSKFTPYKLDNLNPIVVVSSNKGQFPAGKVVTDFAEFVDIAPTILKAGGANIHSAEMNHLDGNNLAWLAQSPTPLRQYVVGESHAVVGPRAYIRTKEYNFSMKTRPDKKKGQDNIWWALAPARNLVTDLDAALYHVTVDPDEKVNLINDPKYKDVVAALREKLGNAVLGDRRAEIDWQAGGKNNSNNFDATNVRIYSFARGSHNGKITVPNVSGSKEILDTLEGENKNVVYPNPVSEGLIILGDRFVGKNFTISNMLGGAVISNTYKGGFVDVSSLIAGVYVLSIDVSDDVQVVEKLIVQ